MKKNYTNHIMAIVMIFLFSENFAFSQLATWELSALSGTTIGPVNASTLGGNITSSLLNRGAGVTATSQIGGFSSSGWFNTNGVQTTLSEAINNNEYYEFSLLINSGFQANITSIDISLRGSNTGPNSASLKSSADGFNTTLGTATVTTTDGLKNFPLTLNGITGTLTFRLYGYGNAANAAGGSTPATGGTLRIGPFTGNDLIISGSTSAVSTTPTLTINDVTQIEGNSGTIDYNFTVSLSAPAPAGGVSFDIATADNTATTAGNDYVANSLTGQTIPEGSSSYTFTVTVNGDTDVEGNETFLVNVTNITGANAGDTQGQGSITNDDFGITKIHTIQGSGLSAALTGTQSVQGIVTKTFFGTGSLNGFYVQEEDSDADSDPATSEGIFVFNPPSQPNVGDMVTVTGTVIDFGTTQPLTEFSPTASITLISSGNTLPAAVPVQLPVTEVNDLERYEGMLVTLTAASGNLVVTENFELGRYGQIVLAANDPLTNAPGTDARIDQYTQFNMPSVAGNTEYQAAIKKRTIYVDDANTQQNIDPIKFGRGGMPLSASNTLRTGDEVASVTAVLDQRFEGYRLQIGSSSELNILPTNVRPATPNLTGNPTLVAGNMNVLNYFNGDGMGGGFPTARGANTQVEFTRQRDKIIAAIVNSGADILSLNEIENDGYGPNSAIQDLVNGLNEATAPGTWTFITPPTGVITATDQITCAMVYKPGKATPVGGMAALTTGEYVEVGRAAIAQTFKQNSNNAKFTLVGGHFKSKGSLNAGPGNPDIGDGQGNNNGQRTRQSEQLATWLATDPTASGDPDFLIVGDLNSYAKEDPITKLENEGYAKLIPNTNTSYQFDGAHGALDHALGNASLQAQVVDAVKWHINADEPTAIDYEIQLDNGTPIKSAEQIISLYNADQFRNSDHDPVLVGLNLCEKPAEILTTATFCEGDSYTWSVNGQTYNQPGLTIAIFAQDECTANQRLELTAIPKTSNTTTQTACDSYTWSLTGETYNTSGTYTKVAGCHTEILNLTVTPSTTNTTTQTACDSYTWSVTEQTYTESGTYTQVVDCVTEVLVLTIDNACPEIVCTTMPADYAIETFMACEADGNTVSVGTIMGNSITAPKVFGLTTNNRTFTLNPTDIISGAIYNMFSGVSSASSKFGLGGATYTNSSTWPRVPLTSAGKLANALFRNSLALYFNLSNSTKLADVAITSIHHTQPLTACGATTGTGVVTSYQLPTAVVSFLNNAANGYPATVQGLYNLSNDALGGKTGLPNLSTIATAIDKINKAYNGCRLISTPASTPATFGTGLKVTENNAAFNAPSKGGLYVTLIEGDLETGNIMGVTEINENGISGFDPILNNTYRLILGTNPEGSRTPQAPVGYKIVGEKITYYNEETLVSGANASGPVDGDISIGSANAAAAKVLAGNRIEVEFLLEPAGALPVNLISFKAKSTQVGNKLTWKTANEVNFSHFEVEKSNDLQSFSKIANVAAQNSESYNYLDSNVNSDAYYRLKMVDINGAYNYSKIVFVSSELDSKIGLVYPNPVQSGKAQINIFTTTAQTAKLRIINEIGRQAAEQSAVLQSGENKVLLDTEGISKGVSFIEIQLGSKYVYRKFIKQ